MSQITPPASSPRLKIFSEESVPLFGPPLPSPPVFTDHQEFRDFLLVKRESGTVSISVFPNGGLGWRSSSHFLDLEKEEESGAEGEAWRISAWLVG